ncbi:MAG: hypothetical protein OXC69_05765 [Candidatus Tectomicrobia bacterium]|nr:hypothetical protein [Candidatus Tectomicrobia bacterium]
MKVFGTVLAVIGLSSSIIISFVPFDTVELTVVGLAVTQGMLLAVIGAVIASAAVVRDAVNNLARAHGHVPADSPTSRAITPPSPESVTDAEQALSDMNYDVSKDGRGWIVTKPSDEQVSLDSDSELMQYAHWLVSRDFKR